jgi:transposase-like protein
MAQRELDGLGDAVRRRYWREADARAVVEAWRRSGESVASFARRHGLKRRRLSPWVSRVEARERAVRFHPVRLVGGNAGVRHEAIEVVLVDGRRVRVPAGSAASDLKRVLAVLEGGV